MSVFLLRFPSPFIPGRHFLGDPNPDARIIEFRIAISPAVILFLRDVPRLQQGGLLFPGLKPLLKICRADSAVKDCRSYTDHAIHIGDSDQIPVLQSKKRVHQSIHGIDVRNSDRLRGNIEYFRHCRCQIRLRRPILTFILRQSDIRFIWQ